MTLTREWPALLAIALAILTAGALFFGGNQRQVHAALGSDIVCFVFTELNKLGEPIPVLSHGDCQNPPGSPPQCSDGIDNDGDGFIDEDDPGCTSDSDNNEFNAPPVCSNGIDDDSDGLVDAADPGCHSDNNAQNSGSYSATDNDETNSSGGGGSSGGSGGGGQGGSGGGGNNSGDSSSGGGGGGGGGGDSGAITQASSGGGGGIISGPLSVGFQSAGGVVLGTQTPAPACEMYLTDFLHIGRKNNPDQVKKLQQFLNDRMGAGLPVTGFFGPLTFAAVEKFQLKYIPDVLDPWALDSHPTGYVYLTTRKKINELYCNNTRAFPLTPEQEKIIERARVSLQTTPSTQTVAPSTPAPTPTFPALTPTLSIPALDIKKIVEPSPPKIAREATGTSTREQATTTPRRSIFESIGEFFRGLFNWGR